MGVVKPVTVNLDKERHLKLTLGGMAKFQEETGKDFLAGFDPKKLTYREQIALFWACLIWEDRKLTVEDVGYMLDLNTMNELTTQLYQAISEGMPQSEGGENPPGRSDG